jgi:hypothetical protein
VGFLLSNWPQIARSTTPPRRPLRLIGHDHFYFALVPKRPTLPDQDITIGNALHHILLDMVSRIVK